MRERFGDDAIHARTGHRRRRSTSPRSSCGCASHEPAARSRRAALALQPRDLVALALTGETATDGTHAAATLVYDLRARRWADDLSRTSGLPGRCSRRFGRPSRSSAACSGRSRAGSACRPACPSSSAAPTARPARSAPAWSRRGR